MVVPLCQLYRPVFKNLARTVSVIQSSSRRTSHRSSGEEHSEQKRNSKTKYLSLAAIGAIGSIGTVHYYQKRRSFEQKLVESNDKTPNTHVSLAREPGVSYYTRKDVAWHCNLERGVWITYNNSVYDITKFIEHHPGGSQTIMMGAGGDVGAFWKTYTVHQASEVQNLLSKFKIGQLDPVDVQAEKQHALEVEGPYANDPERLPIFVVHSQEPFNAETPAELLTETHLTPTDIFFVRNHLPVPEVDIEDYEIEIFLEENDKNGEMNQNLIGSLTYDELKNKFKPFTIQAVIQCSGNRRNQLKKLKEIKGLDWNVGAIGNAEWRGARLVDVLRHFGIDTNDEQLLDSIKHVQAEGLDCDMSGQSYGASITSDVALDPRNDVLLAYEMNGQPLSRDHGYPVRFVAPGIAGARSVKWLSKIVLSNEESRSHWQRNDYKSFSPNVDMFNVDYSKSLSIQEMPVQSAICLPKDGDVIVVDQDSRTVRAKGFAWSGAGKTIVRVDVSADNGANWTTANLLRPPIDESQRNRNRDWSWSLWTADIVVPNEALGTSGHGQVELLCRAFDASYNSQPERPDAIWNVRGVVNNAWHRVKITVSTS